MEKRYQPKNVTHPAQLSRRAFLKQAALLGMGALLLHPQSRMRAAGRSVIVIGAGVAGLKAAADLTAAGLSVTVLEGRDRLGGRIWTANLADTPIDLGAAWIHGTQGNPIAALAEESDITTRRSEVDACQIYLADGKPLTREQYRRLTTFYSVGLLEIERRKEIASPTDSLAFLRQWVNRLPLEAQLKQAMRWGLNSEVVLTYAADFEQLSLAQFGEDEEFEGGDAAFPGGYGQIITRLAEGVKDIRLGMAVKEIRYSASGAVVITERDRLEADYAVITLPLGVLKAEAVTFDPPLPAEKQAAIGRLGFGTLNKIVLHFEDTFWPDEPHYFGFARDDDGPLMDYWAWDKIVNRPVLVALAGGKAGVALTDQSVSSARDIVMTDLRAMFGSAVPDPSAAHMSQWHLDPFALGSYSSLAPGSSPDDYHALAEPTAGRLFFAGEATNAQYPGTVHGAYLSGEREAKRIIDL